MFRYILIFLYCLSVLKADLKKNSIIQSNLIINYYGVQRDDLTPYSEKCYDILEDFAQYASNFTFCSILYAKPITLCEKCVEKYVKFRDKYQELLSTTINGTSCRSIFISQDRLNAIEEYHDNILSIWNKGNCNGCFDWNKGNPSLKNDTIHFHKLSNDTRKCIVENMNPNNTDVCNRCMQSYIALDEFYKTLSVDSIGVDSVCMDIVDSMNSTRYIWSKTFDCCNLRKTPEVVFLCCAGIISFLPIVYYLTVRFCAPLRDLPNVLKQSRFKQTILRSINGRSD